MSLTSGSTTPTTPRSVTLSFGSRSISFSRGRDKNVAELPKGPLGLTTLYVPDPENTPAPVADIIFVHGLNGGSSSTWSKGNDPECYWPQKWLPTEEGFADVRIHTFGYPAAVTRQSILSIPDFARSLLVAIHDSPSMSQGRQASLGQIRPSPPLIFVAHSMGGLVVKQAYLIARREAAFGPIADR
ncbi:uncharacterized protein P884DRAFT_211950, partial [Thermothelomyces heterothallicus CBS 202.75]|uniref:uncharacterized protein n=1 Tax=Thermothelomyces heterothallicus CBS 202.75 TaxID=1149848 RepID=UPI0037433731